MLRQLFKTFEVNPGCTRILPIRSISLLNRLWRGQQAEVGNNESKIKDILRNRFPKASLIEVNDISGGCGAMYDISVESPDFQGVKMVKQHQMINEALKKEIKDMHGLRIHTSVPST